MPSIGEAQATPLGPPPATSSRAGLTATVGIAIASLVVVLAAAHFYFEAFVVTNRVRPGLHTQLVADLAIAIPLLAAAAVGAVILVRQPRNRVGWLALVTALLAALSSWTAVDYAAIGMDLSPASVPSPLLPLWLGQMSPFLYLGLYLVVLPLIFPDGRLQSRRWLWVLVTYLCSLVMAVPTLFDPLVLQAYGVGNPYSISRWAGYVADAPSTLLFVGLFLGSAIAALTSLVRRYEGAGAELRHQIKWLIPSGVLTLCGLAVAGLASSAVISPVAVSLTAASLPVAIAFAVLKYHLFDIDIVINRALVFGALAAFITVIYVGIVVGIGTLIGSGGKPNLALSIVATAIVAIAFQPLRERLQKVANRMVYGKRATPYEVLSEFSERAAETLGAEEVLPRMVAVLAAGTAAERASVWLRAGASLRLAAQHPVMAEGAPSVPVAGQLMPAIPGAERAVAVRHQGELLGALTVSKRRGESLTPIEEKLLSDLANQAGLVLKNVGLTADLRAKLEELRASRQRLVAAQDMERKRIERNLHDGAQQHLVALKVKLGLVEALAAKDPEKARATLTQLKSDADEALETLRDLARGIYPPVLADKGLVAALEAQARKATLPVNIEADGVGRYPQEVESAVYFCCLEALQNVQKYAQAKQAVVTLAAEDGELVFDVKDDGRGFDPEHAKTGSGLQNMKDRLEALGGQVRVESSAAHGTKVIGTVPGREVRAA